MRTIYFPQDPTFETTLGYDVVVDSIAPKSTNAQNSF